MIQAVILAGRARLRAAGLCLIGLLAGAATLAHAEPATRYALDLSDRQAQDLHVAITFEEVSAATLEVHLPVFRTGLYRVLDPVGTVSDVRAEAADGTSLAVTQFAKSSWRIERPADRTGAVTVRYVVFANSVADRTRDVDSDHAFINPGPVLMYADGWRDRPVTVTLDLPEGWRVASGMAQPVPGTLQAPDYDRLVDSPIEAGTFDLVEFEAAGIDVQFAIHGTWDGDAERLQRDTTALMEAAAAVYGSDQPPPASRYLFLTHSQAGLGGGTEYYNSTVVHVDPRAWWDAKRYRGFLSLLTHEFFHTWNVKRARPAGIARYDYLEENYTDLLWVAEGLTSYYDEILLVRAGLLKVDAWRDKLAATIDGVVDRPAYGRQSLAQASFEAWTKGYHAGADRAPDKPNRSVSFYAQGGLLGLVLDLEIRAASGSAHSLDDVMRALYEDFPFGGAGFTYADVRARVGEYGGAALAERLDGWALGTDPLPLQEVLAEVGWRLEREVPKADAPTTSIGLTTADDHGALRVRWVALEGPAWRAGINAGDELLALEDARIAGAGLDELLRRHAPGDRVELALFRDGRLRRVPLELAAARPDHRIEAEADVDPVTLILRRDWLGGRDEADGD
ncbi:MAG TPA: PDZ domain-containing protein, partial [Pseudomonadales bacterium]|nr:PDZ domain-containing protein [Pseudomonadales bacterium]